MLIDIGQWKRQRVYDKDNNDTSYADSAGDLMETLLTELDKINNW